MNKNYQRLSLFFQYLYHHELCDNTIQKIFNVTCKTCWRKCSGIIHLVRSQNFQKKNNISYPLIRTRTCVNQGVRNVSFSEDFVEHVHNNIDSANLEKQNKTKTWHCVKSVRIWSFSGPYFPAFGPEKLGIQTVFAQCETITKNQLAR